MKLTRDHARQAGITIALYVVFVSQYVGPRRSLLSAVTPILGGGLILTAALTLQVMRRRDILHYAWARALVAKFGIGTGLLALAFVALIAVLLIIFVLWLWELFHL